MRLLMATNNNHKLREVSAMLAPLGIEIDPLSSIPGIGEPAEDQDDFEGNALQKARFVFGITGRATVADDSGIEVRALGWAPGVRSKRFSDEGTDVANNQKLIALLQGEDDRFARFRCAIAVVAEGVEGTCSGECPGVIGDEARGGGGFGYDPHFWPEATPGRTMAELSMEEKNAISHRAEAVGRLPRLLRELGLL